MCNIYSKYVPNVFLAKCTEEHKKGEVIAVTTKYGKENESIIFNLIYEKEGYFYYSIVRADGFNCQEWAKKQAEKLENAALNSEKKSNDYYEKSNKDRDFLVLGEPVKVGHHSENKHLQIIEQANNNMRNCVELSDKADNQKERSEYWAKRVGTINLSLPGCLDFYEFEFKKAKLNHERLKNGTIEKSHSFSLTYAKKEVNELEKKVQLAKLLWD